jgi:hypothetical protein
LIVVHAVRWCKAAVGECSRAQRYTATWKHHTQNLMTESIQGQAKHCSAHSDYQTKKVVALVPISLRDACMLPVCGSSACQVVVDALRPVGPVCRLQYHPEAPHTKLCEREHPVTSNTLQCTNQL